MRAIIPLFAALALAGPAAAQTQIVESRFAKAPWWMDQPIIASTGYVEKEFEANRAEFTANFLVVEKTVAEANKKASDQARELGLALIQPGADKVRVATELEITPLYEQYRDKDGERVDNERPDKIERYAVQVRFEIEVRDLALIERVYAAALSARPTSVSEVEFRFEPSNEIKTDLFRAAVTDAKRRAGLATDASGAKLGAVKLIDPTGRACETDVLVAGAPRSPDVRADSDLEEVIVTGSLHKPPAPAPAPPTRQMTAAEIMSGQPLPADQTPLPLQPPLQRLQSTACVVYALGG